MSRSFAFLELRVLDTYQVGKKCMLLVVTAEVRTAWG